MSNGLKDFHHYKGDDLTKFEKIERRVMEMIATSKVPDDQREDSKSFEFMHAAGCIQVARILAQNRNLNVDLGATATILHDIYVIVNGTYKDHGKLGVPIARKMLEEVGGFTDEEVKTIIDAVAHHSEKEIHSDDPYMELVKDADVFECSLYKNAEGFYKIHKPPYIYDEYVKRIKKVRNELGLKVEDVFR